MRSRRSRKQEAPRSRADRVYRLVHSPGPRLLRGTAFETVEVVEIATNEIVLFWDVPVRDARRFVARLRTDLVNLEAEDFLARWSDETSGGS